MRRWVLIVCVVMVLVACAVGVSIHYLYDTGRELSNQIYEPLPMMPQVQIGAATKDVLVKREMEQLEEKQVLLHRSFTILVIGVDRRSGDKGRADVLLVATVNPHDKTTWMMNIPRDTRTTLVGVDIEDKVNHSYAYGGAAMTIASVEYLIGIPIDYYIKVEMEGFQQIIDTIGGIEVDNPLDFQYEGYDFPVGDLELQGKEALAYVRMRYDDPQGDIGRNERQKLVIKAVMRNLLQIQSVFNLNEIAETIAQHVKTNLTFEEWKRMSVDYRDALNRIETENLNGHGQIIDDIYYYIVDDEEKLRIAEQLQLHLDE